MKSNSKKQVSIKDIIVISLLVINLTISIALAIGFVNISKFNKETLPIIHGKQELLMSEKIECFNKTGNSFNCEGIKRESQQIQDLHK